MKLLVFVILILLLLAILLIMNNTTTEHFTDCDKGIGPNGGDPICCSNGTFEYNKTKYCNLPPCGGDNDPPCSHCGRLTASDHAGLICCPSGDTDLYGGFYYCTQMDDGSVCFSDAMCKDGSECLKPSVNISTANIIHTKSQCYDAYNTAVCGSYSALSGIKEIIGDAVHKGICVKKQKNPGDSCDVNADDNTIDGCTYKCGYTSMISDGSPNGNAICCKKDQKIVIDGFNDKYCTPFPLDAFCDGNDKLCETGSYCTDSNKDSVCKKQKKENEECENNNECNNNLCGRDRAGDDAKKICCPKGLTSYAGFDYCNELPDDTICWSDNMCKSGKCVKEGNIITNPFMTGKCSSSTSGTKEFNAECVSGDECQNTICAKATADDNAKKICCPYEKLLGFSTYDGVDYCKRMQDDATCLTNDMCDSGTCEIPLLAEKGKCASSCGGQPCPVGTECISQIDPLTKINHSICCNRNRVFIGIDGKLECCSDGSLYDATNKICRASCGSDGLCKPNTHCANNKCVNN